LRIKRPALGNDKNTFFLVVEGLDGTGKSSITRALVQILQATLGKNVKLTFEPHDPSCAGLFIRQILMRKLLNVPAKTLALAFAVNRADHCDREISSFLNQRNGNPRVVVCDRYYLSSLVYQSTDEISYDDIMTLNSAALRPDLTIFLSASSKTCYERMRNRREDKELFETNLNRTKQKYVDAIEYLKKRGDKVIQVEAEGSISDVVHNVLSTLTENAPKWLTVQQALKIDETQHVFEPSSITIEAIAGEFADYWKNIPITDATKLTGAFNKLQTEITECIDKMLFNDVATLFLDAIVSSGYTIAAKKLPWTDLDAYELQYILPFNVLKRGAALLLGETQRYDIVMGKLLSSQKVMTLRGMSDFLLIFDSNPSHLITDYYEREVVNYGDSSALSPSFVVIGRKEIGREVFRKVLVMLRKHYLTVLNSQSSLKDMFDKYLRETNAIGLYK
jgi:dTMP kinase